MLRSLAQGVTEGQGGRLHNESVHLWSPDRLGRIILQPVHQVVAGLEEIEERIANALHLVPTLCAIIPLCIEPGARPLHPLVVLLPFCHCRSRASVSLWVSPRLWGCRLDWLRPVYDARSI